MRSTLTIVSMLLALAPLPTHAATELTLKPAALVAGSRVTLADVALAPAAAAGELAAIELGRAPLPGYTARLGRAEIARTLRARALPYTVAAGGSDSVRIERRVQAWDQAPLMAAARALLAAHLASGGGQVELHTAGTLPEFQLPAGAVTLRPRPLASDLALRPRMSAWIDILVDGAFVRSVGVPFEVRVKRPVLVATRDLAPGERPDCASMAQTEQDIATLDAAPAGGDCAALQGRLKRALAKGAPLLKAHLQTEFAVTQGESVGLRMRDGAIVLESRAIALSDGSIGQRIDVRPAGATQAVRAEVVGTAQVSIH